MSQNVVTDNNKHVRTEPRAEKASVIYQALFNAARRSCPGFAAFSVPIVQIGHNCWAKCGRFKLSVPTFTVFWRLFHLRRFNNFSELCFDCWWNFFIFFLRIWFDLETVSAHCTFNRNRSSLMVRAGSTFQSSGGIEVDVSHIIQHPRFSPLNYDFDFSLLRFTTSLTFNNQMRAVRLPPRDGDALRPGTKCLVSGYGMTEQGDVAEDLRSAEVKIIEDLNCKSNYAHIGFETTKQMICAGENNTQKENGNRDACSGDSVSFVRTWDCNNHWDFNFQGGPLVCGGIFTGVVSLGYSCGLPNFPGKLLVAEKTWKLQLKLISGLYSRVSSVRHWIRIITGVWETEELLKNRSKSFKILNKTSLETFVRSRSFQSWLFACKF